MIRESRWVYSIHDQRGASCHWAGREMVPEYPVSIYGLRAVDETEFRYVGSTDWPPQRLAAHWRDCAAPDPKGQWLQELRERGQTPVMVVLEMTTPAKRKELELRWINFLRAEGHRLTNAGRW